MGILLSDEERRSLSRDLAGPVKSFLREVGSDTVGDAKKFYAAQARRAEQNLKQTREKTRAQMAAIRREQEEMKKHRRAMMKRAGITIALLALFSLIVVSLALSAASAEEPDKGAWQSIPQAEAKRLMDEGDVFAILDVRTQEEYDIGHIPGAVCIPVETIDAPPELLPRYDSTILVYCRSGRRSKLAAEELASMGYTDVREFGGIIDWDGETVTSEEDTPFLAFTGLTRMGMALKTGAKFEKVYYTDGYGFSSSEFETTDAAEIEALWDALRGVTLGRPSGTGITDWYPLIVFYLDNGQRYSVRFEGPWLDLGTNFELENAEAFWTLTKSLVGKYGGQTA